MSKYTQIPLPLLDATVEIPLTKGYVAIVDAIDADLALLKWSAFGKLPYVYAVHRVKTKGKSTGFLMHRIILERILNRKLTSKELVDHINHNSLDNTRTNLRLSNKRTNSQNTFVYASNKTGFKGVYKPKDKNLFCATIKVDGKKVHIGYYRTAIEAACAYNASALKYFGEFALINNIPDWREKLNNARTAGLNINNTSGYKGVTKYKDKWRAQVMVNRKGISLGTFDTAEEANEARMKFDKGKAA